ncbi:hypothetical protein DRP53_09955, partial [candidate division WOR-3 bacterium]
MIGDKVYVIYHGRGEKISQEGDIFLRQRYAPGQWTQRINVTDDYTGYPYAPKLEEKVVLWTDGGRRLWFRNHHLIGISRSKVLIECAERCTIFGYSSESYRKPGILGDWIGIAYTTDDVPDPHPTRYRIDFVEKLLPTEHARHIAPSHNPYATGHNNARRLLRDGQKLHLVYTDSFGVYHTYLADTSWSTPQYLGRGEYPCLFQLPDGKIGCIYPDNFGHNCHELLKITTYDGSWSSPDSLLHTYDSNLWGIGAPSVAIRDSIVHFTFESSHGM